MIIKIIKQPYLQQGHLDQLLHKDPATKKQGDNWSRMTTKTHIIHDKSCALTLSLETFLSVFWLYQY